MNNITQQMLELTNEINKHNHAYHVLNKPIISDIEFDKLFKKLKELEQEYPDLKLQNSPTDKVGGLSKDTFAKVRHIVRMYSLDNVFNEQELKKFHRRFTPFYKEYDKETVDQFYVDTKMDGVALDLWYQDGKFTKAVTRGDGHVGDDVTENAMRIVNIPKRMNTKSTMFVRGEVVVHREDFNNVNVLNESKGLPTFSNMRNYAAGSLRQKDPNVTAERHLRFYAYDYTRAKPVNADDPIDNRHDAKIQILKKLGFSTPQGKVCTSIYEIMEAIAALEKSRSSLPYDIDGVVVKHNMCRLAEQVGYNNHHPLWAVAWKFTVGGVPTTIKEIKWNIGRTGKLTPVASLQPVTIGGVNIKEVTLSNVNYVLHNRLGVGAKVTIIRSGDVIPKIQTILSSGNFTDESVPKICPYCDVSTEHIGADLRCVNPECPETFIAQLKYVTSKDVLNVKGIGDAFIQNLVDNRLVNTLTDLFSYIELPTNGSAQNLADALVKRMRNINLMELLMIIGIPNMGKAIARKTVMEVGSLQGFIDYVSDSNKLANLQLGEAVKANLLQWYSFERNRNLLETIKSMQLIYL